MKKVKCFQCGDVVTLTEAVNKGWSINRNSYWKEEGHYGTCPDELRVQREADDQYNFQRKLEDFGVI